MVARLRQFRAEKRASTSDLDRMLAELFSAPMPPPQEAAAHPPR
jgi:hypothetical protein